MPNGPRRAELQLVKVDEQIGGLATHGRIDLPRVQHPCWNDVAAGVAKLGQVRLQPGAKRRRVLERHAPLRLAATDVEEDSGVVAARAPRRRMLPIDVDLLD